MPAKPKFVQRNADAKSKQRSQAASDEALKRRQSDRLDEALLETFPASDSVSIGAVK